MTLKRMLAQPSIQRQHATAEVLGAVASIEGDGLLQAHELVVEHAGRGQQARELRDRTGGPIQDLNELLPRSLIETKHPAVDKRVLGERSCGLNDSQCAYITRGAMPGTHPTANTMARMQLKPTAALLLSAAACLALSACGSSQTKTVTVASSPAETQSTTTSAPSTTTATTPTTTTTKTTAPPASANGGAEAPTSTHTATEPAFTQQEPHNQGISEAVSVLKAHGYSANETSQYHPNQTLQVLIGTSASSSDGYTQQAFFFVRGRYIGTDTKLPSASVDVVAQSDTEVTLSYPLYRPNDPISSPSGGHAVVRFQLNNGQLTSLDPIPPASSSSGLSRN
jgi:hypothetical protein